MRDGTIKSVRIALQVLKCVASGETRVSDIGKKLKLSKSTTYRLLKTLEESGVLYKDPLNHHYHLGDVFLKLASEAALSSERLRICALEEMHRLRDISGETVIIYARMGRRIVCLEELPSKQNIKYTVGKGTSIPLNVGSASRVLLSELDDKEIDKIIKNVDFVSFTPGTITDKVTFRESVRKVRQIGYARSRSTYIPGTSGISVPVKNYIYPIALSILGPENRFETRINDILRKVKRSAKRISLRLLTEY